MSLQMWRNASSATLSPFGGVRTVVELAINSRTLVELKVDRETGRGKARGAATPLKY